MNAAGYCETHWASPCSATAVCTVAPDSSSTFPVFVSFDCFEGALSEERTWTQQQEGVTQEEALGHACPSLGNSTHHPQGLSLQNCNPCIPAAAKHSN